MAYDETLDVVSFKKDFSNEKTRITVALYSYNGGPKKIQISRENMVDGEWNFTKLGRLNKEELEKVIPLLIEASEEM